MIIAIDGLAASGKGTVAKRLAHRFGFAHLDTGALYRAVGAKLADTGADPEDPSTEPLAAEIARGLTVADLERPDLRDARAGQAASHVARRPAVRAALLDYQRDFAARPPGGAKGAVLDGRDIASHICPQAEVKIFVEARPAVRAQRRAKELTARGFEVDLVQIEADLIARDERDRTRAESPMVKTADAVLLDTSDLSMEAMIEAAASIVLRHIHLDRPAD